MKPSGKFEGLTKTPEHDNIHLWMSKNVREALISVYCDEWIEFEVHKNAKILVEIEKPIYHSDYLVAIVDGVIDINDKFHCLEENGIYRRIIYEIKPHLDSVSGAMGQIKAYAERLKYFAWTEGEKDQEMSNPYMLVLTIDKSRRFDDMLKSQGIRVAHLLFGDLQ